MRFTKTMAAMAVLALALVAYAASEKGTISGKVLDAEGKPVAKATVEIRLPKQSAKKESTEIELAGDAGKNEGAPDDGKKKKKRQVPPPVAQTKTDDAGAFSLADIEPGEYVVIAYKPRVGSTRESITLAAGETESVELTLTPKAKKPKEDHEDDQKKDKPKGDDKAK